MAVEVKLSEPVDLGGMKFTSITIPDKVLVEHAVKIGETEITGRGRVMELLVALAGVPREVIFQQPARFIRDLGGNAEAAALLSRHVAECSEGNSEEEATGA
ncbi:hypothetical protein ATO13_22661 [Stappia sp. 22II-S9-Z10]|nr:hypothetical protein ATO13_22661 [Stappia sp. 22II-S9-Z10]